MKFTQVFAYIIGCLFSICIDVGIFILFAVAYESMHTTGVKIEDAAPHDYVEVDLSDPENVFVKSYNGYSARNEYTLDRWQTEEGVIAVTIYFEEADNEK